MVDRGGQHDRGYNNRGTETSWERVNRLITSSGITNSTAIELIQQLSRVQLIPNPPKEIDPQIIRDRIEKVSHQIGKTGNVAGAVAILDVLRMI